MTSSENETLETWQPEPPALLPPWHTPEREKLQEQARRFAMDEVLPVANELDPQKGEIPASLLSRLAELGYFGITVPAEHGGLGLGVFEYCMVSEELARAWMSTASILARSQGLGRRCPTTAAGTSCWPAAPAATGSARSRCPSPTPAPTSRASPPARSSTATSGWSPGASAGAATRRRPTSSRCWCASATRRRASPGRQGLVNLLLEKKRGEFPEGLSGYPIDKVGYHGFLTWDLTLRRRPHPEGQRHRRGRPRGGQRRGGRRRQAGRVRRGAEVPQHRPRAHRRPRRRPGPGRAGGLDPLPAGARAVRPPDRRLPGAALRRRRDGRADRAVPGLLPAGRPPARPRRCRARRRRRWSSSRPPRCRCG